MTTATPPAPSSRRLVRLAHLLFLDGFRAAPGWMSLVTAMLVLGSIASTCYPLGYRLLLDGALAGDTGQVVGGVLLIAGLLSIGWVLTALGGTDAMALSDRVAVFRTAGLIRLISGVRGLEHLERPEYLTEVEHINTNRRLLASAPRQLIANLASVARILTLLVLLAVVSPWLLLLPVCALPPMLADRLAKRITRATEDGLAADRRLAGLLFGLAATPTAAGEIRAYGLGRRLADEHARLSARINRASRAEALKVLGVQGAGWLIYALGLMAAIALVVLRASDGALSLGAVLMSVSLIRRSRAQLASAALNSGRLVTTLTTADRLLWLEDHAAAEAARAGQAPPPAALGDGITLRGLEFRYPGADTPVLAGVDLRLPAGGTVALVGENGAGKSTLAKLLLGMYEPTEGEILLDGQPLSELDPIAWRERCTAAFQDYTRFHLPAVESVGVGDLPRRTDADAVGVALGRAGAEDLPAQLPDGLATTVGSGYTGGRNLSGGQWQKLALGRAMMRDDPLLVVLDEPTASLDAAAEHALFERYAQAARRGAAAVGSVTLLVSHRFSTVRMADLVVVLEDGKVLESGSHEELLAAGGRYAELFEIQAAGYR
jgi:ATP-binding cassette subfamily B protein